MRPREDSRRRLVLEALERDPGIGELGQPAGPGLDKRDEQRPELVERGPALGIVFLERKRDLRAASTSLWSSEKPARQKQRRDS